MSIYLYISFFVKLLFFYKKSSLKKIKKLFLYNYHYNYTLLYIIMYKELFLIFFNLTFCKRNNANIILLIIFCVLIIIELFFLYQTIILQNKKVYINMYGHISYIIIYIYIFFYIFLYKKFFTGFFIFFNIQYLFLFLILFLLVCVRSSCNLK